MSRQPVEIERSGEVHHGEITPLIDVSRHQRVITAAPDVGHGNGFAAMAIAAIADTAGIESIHLPLNSFVSKLAGVFHRRMSTSSAATEAYSAFSETLRTLFGKILAPSLATAFHRSLVTGNEERSPSPATQLVLTQEHVLAGLDPEALLNHGIDTITVFIPDVYPKESSVAAVREYVQLVKTLKAGSRLHSNFTIEMAVWNRDAYDQLSAQGIPVRLVAPVLPNGWYADGTLPDGGKQVVFKSSGSGWPAELEDYAQQHLEAYAPGTAIVYGPDYYQQRIAADERCAVASEQQIAAADQRGHYQEIADLPNSDLTSEQIKNSLVTSLGMNTVLVYSFPSEMVQVVWQLRQMQLQAGKKADDLVQLVAFNPRGAHEIKNLIWAIRQGIVANYRDEDIEKLIKMLPPASRNLSNGTGRVTRLSTAE